MNREELLNLKKNIENKYFILLPKYHNLMKIYFPLYLEDYSSLVKKTNILNDESDMFQFLDEEDTNYNDPLYSKDTCDLSHLFYPYIYENKFNMSNDNIIFIKKFINLVNNGRLLQDIFNNQYKILNYIDSLILHFDSEDIIITDPCYFTDNYDDLANNGKMIYSSTLYGDWSCTVYDTNNKILGEFCADAGLVCAISLKELLKVNPNFDYHINRKWTTTLIPSFTGDIQIKVDYNNEFYCYVEGIGNVNFKSKQTGL